jgi:hypothetical protein
MVFSTKVGALVPPEAHFTLSFIAVMWCTCLLTYATLVAANVTAGYFGPNSAHCINYSTICVCWYCTVHGGVSGNKRNGADVRICGQCRSVYGRHDGTVCYTFHCCV